MASKQSHSSLLALCGLVLVATVICVENKEAQQDLNNPKDEDLSSGNEVMHWPWPNRKFKCPSAWGAYPDTSSCAHFYICAAKFATRTRCPLMYNFCKEKRVCLPILVAVCDDGKDEVTKEEKATTEIETEFVCPEERGKFPYPHDCAKYYSCRNDQAALETCRDSQLFDGIKRRCRSAEKVHCGSRLRPTDVPVLETTQDISSNPDDSTDETVDEEIITTLDDSTDETVDEEIITTLDDSTDVTSESPGITEEEVSTQPEETTTPQEEVITTQEEIITSQEDTTPKVRVTAPDTDCDADDLDCIIDDLGETPDWFVCPDDLGSYPHPTSQKLFIFCLNWKPLVKKCGQDLVFSEDHMTCISPEEFSSV